MKPLRRLTNLLAACAVAAAALIQPASRRTWRKTRSLPITPNGSTTNPAANTTSSATRAAAFPTAPAKSTSSKTIPPDGQPAYPTGKHQRHNRLPHPLFRTRTRRTRPFDNHAADSASEEKGNVDDGFTVYRLNWEGHEHHPADAYDGPKAAITQTYGARDEYTYHVNGTARSIKLNPTDTRSIRQRISDNYNNLGSNFSDRADEANRKMFEHNAKLDRRGNSMEFVNGVAAGALNPFISAGEALGIGDILYGTRYAIDKAAMRNIAPLPAEGKFAAIGGLGSVAGFEKNTREAVDRWIQENPNAAETVEALVNVLPFAKVKNLTKAAKPGKAAVSGDFSISYKNFSTVKPKVIAKGTINGKTFRDVNQSAKIGSPDSPTLIAQRVNAKIQADGKPRPNATVANSHAEIGVIQQAYNAGETKGASMTMTVSGKDVCGYCKGDIAAAAQASGLKSLTVNATDNVTGKNKTYYWTPGMKSIKERK
ncbi:hypothetical protein TFGB2_01662 [Neisseria gonorrhoeae]|nr:hypothetical protein TFGB2_01662 [Neisseria gonorrhoeae]